MVTAAIIRKFFLGPPSFNWSGVYVAIGSIVFSWAMRSLDDVPTEKFVRDLQGIPARSISHRQPHTWQVCVYRLDPTAHWKILTGLTPAPRSTSRPSTTRAVGSTGFKQNPLTQNSLTQNLATQTSVTSTGRSPLSSVTKRAQPYRLLLVFVGALLAVIWYCAWSI